DSRFTEPMLWNLGEKPIRMESIPPTAFDTPEERARVAALLDQYNNPPGSNNPKPVDSDSDASDEETDAGDTADDSSDVNADETQDDTSSADESSDEDEDAKFVVKMTPEIDAAFGQIAEERIER